MCYPLLFLCTLHTYQISFFGLLVIKTLFVILVLNIISSAIPLYTLYQTFRLHFFNIMITKTLFGILVLYIILHYSTVHRIPNFQVSHFCYLDNKNIFNISVLYIILRYSSVHSFTKIIFSPV